MQVMYLEMKRYYPQALDLLNRTIVQHPNFTPALVTKAKILIKSGDWEQVWVVRVVGLVEVVMMGLHQTAFWTSVGTSHKAQVFFSFQLRTYLQHRLGPVLCCASTCAFVTARLTLCFLAREILWSGDPEGPQFGLHHPPSPFHLPRLVSVVHHGADQRPNTA